MLVTIYCAFLGLVIGSAINAIVWRLYVGRSWAKGRSECPECKHVLAPKDLVPVISWLWLRGKCRYCKQPIKDSPIVEVVTALAFGVSAYVLAPVTATGFVLTGLWLVLLTLLIILAVYDARWMILPDKIMFPAMGVAVVLLATRALTEHSWIAARGPVVAALVFGGAFLALVAGSRGRAMGGGDIKLAFLMGLALGLRGTLLALLIAFDVAALVAVILIVAKKRGRKDMIPFGPFLVGGTVIAYLYGGQVVHWYLHLNGLV